MKPGHEAFCPASLHDGTPTSVGVPSLFRSRPAKQRRSLDRILGSGMFPRLVNVLRSDTVAFAWWTGTHTLILPP